jgi:Ca2+-binding EF-hand superfamily protein
MLILRFTISDISVDGLTAKEALLLWCQRKTVGYTGVDVRNFTTSWASGLAFCSLLHRYRPDLLEYSHLDQDKPKTNVALAFDLAEKHIGIHKLLRVEDVCTQIPDERSIMTYVAQFFHAFSHLDKVETAGRRVVVFTETIQSAWNMQHDYVTRAQALFASIEQTIAHWETSAFDGTYEAAKDQFTKLVEFKVSQKRAWTREKLNLESLFGDIETKLKTYRMNSFEPAAGLTTDDLGRRWKSLLSAEGVLSRRINQQMRKVKESLRVQFAEQINDFSGMLSTLSTHLSTMSGELEQQLADTAYLVEHLDPLQEALRDLQKTSQQCELANVEENDHTIYTYEDMAYEFQLARDAVSKRYQELQNQIVARSKTNITPAHLEEIDSAFRHFDKSGLNALQLNEMVAALASLGLTYDDDEMREIVSSVGNESGRVTWEAFLNFMIDELEDQRTPEQVLMAFKEVADAKGYMTEEDMQASQLPEATVAFLVKSMPRISETELDQEDKESTGYDYVRFMESLLFSSAS